MMMMMMMEVIGVVLYKHGTHSHLSLTLHIILLQGWAYCEIENEWRSGNHGSLKKHLDKKDHARIYSQYKALSERGLNGFLHRKDGFFHWVVQEEAVASSSSAASVASSVTMDSSLTVDGGGKPPPSVPPGYQDHFTNPPLKGVDNMQRHTNLLCGVIARDARPISFPQGDGFTQYLKGLNPELKPPDPKTVMGTLKAMKIKRQMQVGEALKRTRSTKIGRLLNLPTNMKLDYLPMGERQEYKLPVPFQHNSWSCDGWKRRNGASHYLSVCTHSLTHDFHLTNRLIMFREFPHRSLSVNLAAALDTCMVEMGVDDYTEGEVINVDGEEDEKEGEEKEEEIEENDDDDDEE